MDLEVFELRIENSSLKMKVEMLERMLSMNESHMDKIDSNLKLAIQTPVITTGASHKSTIDDSLFVDDFYTALEQNIYDIDNKTIKNCLENHTPNAGLLFLVEQSLKPVHGKFLIKMLSSQFAKFKSNGATTTEHIDKVFKTITKKLYSKCDPVARELSEMIKEDSENFEEEDDIDNVRFNNMRILYDDDKQKQKLLKESLTLFK
jgi:hypothetical protein